MEKFMFPQKTTIFFLLYLVAMVVSAADYPNKKIGYIRGPDTRPCLLFQLEGVTTAGNTGSPWFALSFSHPGYKDIFSIMLAAKMSGKTINVSTSNNTACGHAEVMVIGLP